MKCNRKTAVIASLVLGALGAVLALDTPQPDTPLAGRTARGAGGIVNMMVETLGPTGAAFAFVLMGAGLAVVSAMLCPSQRKGH